MSTAPESRRRRRPPRSTSRKRRRSPPLPSPPRKRRRSCRRQTPRPAAEEGRREEAGGEEGEARLPRRAAAHAEAGSHAVLVAPIVSEKATMAAEKHNQVLFKVLRDATKPEIKAAVELMFKVTVDSVQTVQHQGQDQALRQVVGRPRPRQEGLRLLRRGPGAQLLRGGRVMAVIKVKPTSPGRRARGQDLASAPVQGPARSVAARAADAERRPQQQRPHHDSPQGRRPQAPLPRGRLRAQQGRRSRPRSSASSTTRTARAHIALVVLRRRRAPLHASRRAASRSARRSCRAPRRRSRPATRCRSATSRSARSSTASRCCPARARRSRARPALGATLLAREGTYAQVRLRSGEVRKIHIDCRATIGEVSQRRAQPAPATARPARSAGRASARRFAASR